MSSSSSAALSAPSTAVSQERESESTREGQERWKVLVKDERKKSDERLVRSKRKKNALRLSNPQLCASLAPLPALSHRRRARGGWRRPSRRDVPQRTGHGAPSPSPQRSSRRRTREAQSTPASTCCRPGTRARLWKNSEGR